jgi:type III restriction enzyme
MRVEKSGEPRRCVGWPFDGGRHTASRAEGGLTYGFVYVDQEGFETHRPRDFAGLVAVFRDFQ